MNNPFHLPMSGSESLPSRTARRHSRLQWISMQLPVLLWFICPYLLATGVFQLGTLPALAIAAFCAYLVFLIEFVVVSMPLNLVGVLVRLVLTIQMSGIGAISLDAILFDKEIGQVVRRGELTFLQDRQQVELQKLESGLQQARAERDEAQRRQNAEMQGRREGTGLRGCGPICAKLERQVDARETALAKALGELDAFKRKAEADRETLLHSDAVLREAGLLRRIAALHEFVCEHPPAMWLWVALFLVVMAMESTVLLVKVVRGRTLEEWLEGQREAVVRQRAQRQLVALGVGDPLISERTTYRARG